MGTVHDLLDMKGKAGTLQTGIDRTVVEAASLYMSDEDGSLGFAFSGWAQCALPHRRLAPDARWEIAGERVRLVVEPGLHPSSHDGPMEHIGVPYGSVARLILLFLQMEALRTNSREVELGGVYVNGSRRLEQASADRMLAPSEIKLNASAVAA